MEFSDEEDEKHAFNRNSLIFNEEQSEIFGTIRNECLGSQLNMVNNISDNQNLSNHRKRKSREKIVKESEIKNKKLELLKSKKDMERDKLLKKVMMSNQRNEKPDESLKLMKVIVDIRVLSSAIGCNIMKCLQENEISCSVENQLYENCISWSRNHKETVLNENNELVVVNKILDEDFVIIILEWKNVVEIIHNKQLLVLAKQLRGLFRNKNITLVLYGMKNYFNFQNLKTKNNMKSKVLGTEASSKIKKNDLEYSLAPVVTKEDLEFSLIQVEIFENFNYRNCETPEDLGMIILQYTKSIAQAPFKKAKYTKDIENLEWYAAGESKSVKVDKNGNGLLKLWQSQLCQFNNSGVETSQAIITQYPSPTLLLSSFEECLTTKDKENLLKDIQVRRNTGILASTKRIGPELSKKICLFCLSRDPLKEL